MKGDKLFVDGTPYTEATHGTEMQTGHEGQNISSQKRTAKGLTTRSKSNMDTE